jgi:hypothetical protein
MSPNAAAAITLFLTDLGFSVLTMPSKAEDVSADKPCTQRMKFIFTLISPVNPKGRLRLSDESDAN